MANLAVNDVLLYTLAGSYAGQRTINTFWYRAAAITGTVTQIAAFDALDTRMRAAGGIEATFRGATPEEYTLQQRWFQIIRPIRYRKYVVGGSVAGLFVSVAGTANVSASISRFSEFSSRRDVGGVRVPIGTGPDSIAAGVIETPQLTALNALATAMATTMVTAGAVVSWQPLVTDPGPNNNLRTVFGTQVNPFVRVMRRRTVGLGI